MFRKLANLACLWRVRIDRQFRQFRQPGGITSSAYARFHRQTATGGGQVAMSGDLSFPTAKRDGELGCLAMIAFSHRQLR